MKKVLVSQRVDEYPDRNERRDALDQKLALWLMENKIVPIPVPNLIIYGRGRSEWLSEWIESVQPDGVVLSGGNDIESCPERDATEAFLLDVAREKKWPVLGICRGMQMMAVADGSELIEVEGHVRTVHHLKGEITGEANSYHNQAIKKCPNGYRIAATAEDGHIEAIIHKELPWEGWMWHPEREEVFMERDKERVRKLFDLRSQISD